MACVARVITPGVKFDHVLTLVGPQGAGKSTLLAKLGGQWFNDSFNFSMLHSKEAFELLRGNWIIEIAELSGFRRAEVEAAKQFLSKQSDSFRPAYGRNVIEQPRQCVFFGSTNNHDFLRDSTGGRRFWPVEVFPEKASKDVFKLDQETVNQIWAEAYEYYLDSESLHLDPETEKTAREHQELHFEKDDRTGIIQKYLDTALPEGWEKMNLYERRAYLANEPLREKGTVKRDRVCAAEIFLEALGGSEKDLHPNNTRSIHGIMRNLPGWRDAKTTLKFKGLDYGYQRAYLRIEG